MLFKDEEPPTSKEEAVERRVRPPPEKYDPDKRSHWSITMMLAWIIWGEIDAVRNEWDDYRNGCEDWIFVPNATARAKVERITMMNISTGQIAPFDPDLQKKLQKKLPKKLRKDFQKGSWHHHQWKFSGWRRLCSRAISENLPPQDAIDELWQAAEEGRIKATALEYENAKAYVSNPIEIPAHYWPYLKRTDDPLTGKAMLSGPDGRIYREVQFSRLDAKKLWPKSPSLSGEPLERVEKPEQTKLEPQRWLDWALKKYPKQKKEGPASHIKRLHGLMENASNVTKAWGAATFRRRYYEEIKLNR